MEWQPIETCPQEGYFLVHEDTAIRLLLRIAGKWHKAGYPALASLVCVADTILDLRRIPHE